MTVPLSEVVNTFPSEHCFTLWPLEEYGMAANDGGLSKTKWVKRFVPTLHIVEETDATATARDEGSGRATTATQALSNSGGASQGTTGDATTADVENGDGT